MWLDCHPIWWQFRWIAWIGDNQGDEKITVFGENPCDDFENWGDEMITEICDNSCDDSVTFCFTQYGEFLGDLS